jgi:serine/threonine protein kinase
VIAPGEVLRNRYRIERRIGRGGMGEVFEAVVQEPALGKHDDNEATLIAPTVDSFRVAIKVVNRGLFTDALMTRLQREATAAARIKSPFIPELIEVSTTGEGELFLVMERLYGETLSARLKERRCLTWDEVFQLGDDVLSGLIDAHAAGVVHRDLKPSNIFICGVYPGGSDTVERAKVLDFGVCKLETPEDDEKLTVTGESVGTASYMAPEQIRGASGVNERADLYSFATVMFEALSGQLPHVAVGQMAMLASKLERSAIRLSDAAQVPVPDGLDPLLGKMLSRDPKKRPASALEVRTAWRALGHPVVAPRPSTPGLPASNAPLPTETGLTSGTIHVPLPTSQIGIALAAFSVAASTALLVAMLVTRRRDAAVATDLSATAPGPMPNVAAATSPQPDPPVDPRADPPSTEPPPLPPLMLETMEIADAAPAASSKSRYHGPRQPVVNRTGGSKQPHIADKPRY